jgi:hypothetical protein
MAEHKTLAEALAAFQAEVPKMSKDETAKVKSDKANYTYGYASLDQFVEIVEPVLGKHGLSVTSAPDWVEGRYTLIVTLLHESGEERSGKWPLPNPDRSGPQDIGSAMTYGRRYVGWGLTGTFPGGIDDDGKQAQQAARNGWENARPAQAQAPAEPPKPPKTSWTDEEITTYQQKIKTLDWNKAAVLYDWMAAKDLHQRPIGDSGVTATLVMALHLADVALSLDRTAEDIQAIQQIGATRGLLNTKVSATETLEEALFGAIELAKHAASEQAKDDTPETDGTNFHQGGV